MIICPDDFRVTPDGLYDPSPAASELAWKQCFALLADEALQAAGCLTLLVGIPGAGKSTWAQHRDSPTVVIFDATFSRRIEREPLIEIGKAAGVRVEAVVFLTPISECIRRNWQRPQDRRVPYPVIASMHENLRREPVTLDEGFHRVEAVRP